MRVWCRYIFWEHGGYPHAFIVCESGFDRGFWRDDIIKSDFGHFLIEIRLVCVQMPVFSVENMESGVEFRFVVYAVNRKGRSEPFILDGITFRGVAKYTGMSLFLHPFMSMFNAIAGAFFPTAYINWNEFLFLLSFSRCFSFFVLSLLKKESMYACFSAMNESGAHIYIWLSG